METEHISGEHPILLPTPVVVGHHRESKFSVLTRFLGWLTACMLSISVLVALVSVTSERNNLQSQLSCRAAANVEVNKAIINEQIALADHSVLIGEFIRLIIQTPDTDPARAAIFEDLATRIQNVDSSLDTIGQALKDAVVQQQLSLSAC